MGRRKGIKFRAKSESHTAAEPAVVEWNAKKAWARGRVRYWWMRLRDTYKTGCSPAGDDMRECPAVEFKGRMTQTAGTACAEQNRVTLSIYFLHHESGESFDQTIGHEVAHIWANRWWGHRCGHGPEWERTMVSIGLAAKRCHNYTTKAEREGRKTPVYCGCGTVYKLGPIRFKRFMENRDAYRCRKCRGKCRGKLSLTPPTGD